MRIETGNQNTEQEKAKMSEERAYMLDEGDKEKYLRGIIDRLSAKITKLEDALAEKGNISDTWRAIAKNNDAELDSLKQRIAELEAGKRPANPAGDDIAELVHRAKRSLDDPVASYEESIACATVAMAMMRLREYES